MKHAKKCFFQFKSILLAFEISKPLLPKCIIFNNRQEVSHSASSGETNHMDSSRDEQPKELPFQVQITYTDLDGAQALRLIAKAKPVTRDRAVAEKRKFFCGKLMAN